MKWLLAGVFVATLGAPPAAPSITLLNVVELLAGIVTVATGFLAWRKWQKLTAVQRADLEASAAKKATESAILAMEASLRQYIEDLERTKQQLQEAQAAIAVLEHNLAAANERIKALADALAKVGADRDALQVRLDQAIKERAEITIRLEQNQAAYHATQEKLAELERRVGGRRAADHQDDP